MDPTEKKRIERNARKRDAYHSMSASEKERKLAAQREAYHKRKLENKSRYVPCERAAKRAACTLQSTSGPISTACAEQHTSFVIGQTHVAVAPLTTSTPGDIMEVDASIDTTCAASIGSGGSADDLVSCLFEASVGTSIAPSDGRQADPSSSNQIFFHGVDDLMGAWSQDENVDLGADLHSVSGYRRRDRFARCAALPDVVWELPATPSCHFCGARRFYREPPGFCCASGKIRLAPPAPNDILYNLFTADCSDVGKRFRRRCRTYNNSLALTSIGMKTDPTSCKNIAGIYAMKVNGQVTHRLHPFDSSVVCEKRLQLFFLDGADQIDPSVLVEHDLDAEVLSHLLAALSENPYFKLFKRLRTWDALERFTVVLRSHPRLDQKLYNVPSEHEIGGIWDESTNGSQDMDRDIRVFTQGGVTRSIEYHYGCYDPLQYPLIFPYGEPGWHTGIEKLSSSSGSFSFCPGQHSVAPPLGLDADGVLDMEETVLANNRRVRINVSCREYSCYRAQMRPGERNLVIHAGRLAQQYAIDSYIKLETQRLDWFRLEQQQYDARVDTLQGVFDALGVDGETNANKIGRRMVLPSSFIGGPRDMMKRYLNAMALVQRFGKPDLFLTMTCNPKWKEITDELMPTQTPYDRPDLIARVFKAKLEEFKHEIVNKKLFGEVASYVYVVEYQKRGLPHVHWIIMLKEGHKLRNPALYDRFISAEIPTDDHPFLRSYVLTHMMHGPCGSLNLNNVCMQDGICKNRYPKDFSDVTTHGRDSYPKYRRRDTGVRGTVRGCQLDNRYVVPYSPYLLAKFNCHINVEVCSDIRLVKYLYKYIYKGHDRVVYNVVDGAFLQRVDEIADYQHGRWVSAVESYWRIYAFDLYEMSPTVVVLPIHLPGGQFVTFGRDRPLTDVVENSFHSRTMLTDFFSLNAHDAEAKVLNLLYKDMPHYYTWQSQTRKWKRRQRGHAIGRLVVVDPSEGERYFLKILLLNIRAPPSYEALLTEYTTMHLNFRSSVLARGLIQSDTYAEQCLSEAAQYQMASSLRRLFAVLLVNAAPPNPAQLFARFYKNFSEDFSVSKRNAPSDVYKNTLHSIDEYLSSLGKSLNDFALVPGFRRLTEHEKFTKELDYERSIVVSKEDFFAVSQLNERQRDAFKAIIRKINLNEAGAFFIDGPGGTGKTFLYRALLGYVRSKGDVALAVATSGVAASLLPGGRTAHARFKLPLEFQEGSVARVSKQSSLAKLIVAAKLVIWDEASMANKNSVEALNNMMQDVMDNKADLFGGKVVLFGGDFRQTLPIVRFSSRAGCINASLVTSEIWPRLTKMKLVENIRAREDPDYTNFLLRIGNGSEPVLSDDNIVLPESILFRAGPSSVSSLDLFIDLIFPGISLSILCAEAYMNRAILAPKNECVMYINKVLVEKMPGNSKTYVSYNRTNNIHDQGQYEEYLSGIASGGLPPHELVLKLNAPIMLLRNLNPVEGLCNGTRLLCRQLGENFIGAEIAIGDFKGKHVYIPRIPLEPTDKSLSTIPFKRIQFPVRPCFAMTINKAQGQTLDYVGVYLPEPVFSHGQLYVALSRVRNSRSVKVYIDSKETPESLPNFTKNIVYPEIFELAENGV